MSEAKLRNFLLYLFIGILVWLPLPFASNQPMYWYTGEAAIQVLSILVLVSISVGVLAMPPVLRLAWIPLAFLVFFAVTQLGVHLFWLPRLSVDLFATEQQLIKTVCLLQIFVLTFILVCTEKQFRLLAWALLLSGTFQAVYGTLMTITGVEHIWNYEKVDARGTATGTFINRNHLAGYLEMTLAMGLGLMIASLGETRSQTWRQFFRSLTSALLGEKLRIRVCLVLMVIALILTRSRMGNTAFFVGMGIAGIIGLFVFRKAQPGIVLLFVSILIIDIMLLGTFFGIEQLQQRMERISNVENIRVVIVELSQGLFLQAPWLGHGLGTFSIVFPSVRNETIPVFFEHTHNDLLQFLIEVGIVGSIPLALLFLSSLVMAIRVQTKRRNRFYRAMGFAVTMALVSIGLHSTSDFNLQIFANAATFVCILAMPWLAMYLPSEKARQSQSVPL